MEISNRARRRANIFYHELTLFFIICLFLSLVCQTASIYPPFWQHDLKTTECGPQGVHPSFPVALRYLMHHLNDCNDVTFLKIYFIFLTSVQELKIVLASLNLHVLFQFQDVCPSLTTVQSGWWRIWVHFPGYCLSKSCFSSTHSSSL